MCNALQESFAGASQTTGPSREGNGAQCLDHGNDLDHGDDPEDLPSVSSSSHDLHGKHVELLKYAAGELFLMSVTLLLTHTSTAKVSDAAWKHNAVM